MNKTFSDISHQTSVDRWLSFILIIFMSFTGLQAAEDEEVGKDPKTAMTLSLICPGSGQIYNEKYLKAVAYLAADFYMIYNAYDNHKQFSDSDDLLFRNERNKYIWWGIGTWLLGALDAYVDAHLSLFPSDNLNIGVLNGDVSGLSLSINF